MESTVSSLPNVRRVRFDWSTVETDQWHHSMPEFGAGANAVSLLMPYAEPYVIRMLRAGIDEGDLPADGRRAAEALIGQEAAHVNAHRAFNKSLTSASFTARYLDWFGAWVFARLSTRSNAFGIAFAAAFEILAFCSARWAEADLRAYFGGADEDAATLFLWHLAEEVEHKGIAHDVMCAHPTARSKYRRAFVVAFVVLVGFTIVGGLSLFARNLHVLNPLRWARLVRWGISFAFVVLPVAATSLSDTFHPDQLVDPPWMAMWLREFDPASNTIPVWTNAGDSVSKDSVSNEAVSNEGISASY